MWATMLVSAMGRDARQPAKEDDAVDAVAAVIGRTCRCRVRNRHVVAVVSVAVDVAVHGNTDGNGEYRNGLAIKLRWSW